jgi:hypothetical protein
MSAKIAKRTKMSAFVANYYNLMVLSPSLPRFGTGW